MKDTLQTPLPLVLNNQEQWSQQKMTCCDRCYALKHSSDITITTTY